MVRGRAVFVIKFPILWYFRVGGVKYCCFTVRVWYGFSFIALQSFLGTKLYLTNMRMIVSDSESRQSTDGAVSNNSTASHRARRRHKRGSLMHCLHRTRHGIIPKMLSSRSALLTMCLRRGKFEQAEQVVKVSNKLITITVKLQWDNVFFMIISDLFLTFLSLHLLVCRLES